MFKAHLQLSNFEWLRDVQKRSVVIIPMEYTVLERVENNEWKISLQRDINDVQVINISLQSLCSLLMQQSISYVELSI